MGAKIKRGRKGPALRPKVKKQGKFYFPDPKKKGDLGRSKKKKGRGRNTPTAED